MIILEHGFCSVPTINGFSLVTHLGIGLLNGKVYLCPILLGNPKILSKVVVPIYNHTGSV